MRFVFAFALVGVLGCGTTPSHGHDAGSDAGQDAARVPRDAWFGDTNAPDTGACASAPTVADVAPIFTGSCAIPACHSRFSPDPGGGLLLDRADLRSALVGVSSSFEPGVFYVIPGDPEHSLVWRKLTNQLAADGTEGEPMPQGDTMNWMPLPADQLELVRCWIATGAN